jgi:hypothetical protein
MTADFIMLTTALHVLLSFFAFYILASLTASLFRFQQQ